MVQDDHLLLLGGRTKLLLSGAGALDPAVMDYVVSRCSTSAGEKIGFFAMYGLPPPSTDGNPASQHVLSHSKAHFF